MLFANYLEAQQHNQQILTSLLKVILSKRASFVGTKTFCSALKVVQTAIKMRKTRAMIQEHINSILYEISLPQMLLNEKEFHLF